VRWGGGSRLGGVGDALFRLTRRDGARRLFGAQSCLGPAPRPVPLARGAASASGGAAGRPPHQDVDAAAADKGKNERARQVALWHAPLLGAVLDP
jgi:hypothetical protein